MAPGHYGTTALPHIGFGTSPVRGTRRVDLEEPVRIALETGYRLFDFAEAYGNELAMGRAIATVPRSELFLVGKVWPTNFRPEHLRAACEASMQRLGIDAFDLYLLHAPQAWLHVAPLDDASVIGWQELERRAMPRGSDDVPLRETWEAMQSLVRDGLARSVGVSNFAPDQIEQLGGPLPAANQIACPPSSPNVETVSWCQARGITILGHSPLSSAPPSEKFVELARRQGMTPAQAILRWHIDRGVIPLPTSTRADRIRENFEAAYPGGRDVLS